LVGSLPVVAELSDAKRRIIERMKRSESCTAPELASVFALTDTAVRQHLEALESAGLVERAPSTPNGRGRPPLAWRLTPLATDLFPDRHADLTVELLASVQRALGADALDRVIDERAAVQLGHYRASLRPEAPLAERVSRLAELRSAEGYLAEAFPAEGGGMVLVEHHCPVADAARSCGGLCRSELTVFSGALGDGVRVERTQHLMAGDQRCAYLVRDLAG
jgi:predicted ArsR family transcriptional regulator